MCFFLIAEAKTQNCPTLVSFEAIEEEGQPTQEFLFGCTPVTFKIKIFNSEDDPLSPATVRLILDESEYDFANADMGLFSQVLPDPDPNDGLAEFEAVVTLPGTNSPTVGELCLYFTVPFASSLNNEIIFANIAQLEYGTCALDEIDINVNVVLPRTVGWAGGNYNLSAVAIDVVGDGINFLDQLWAPNGSPLPRMDAVIHGTMTVDLVGYEFRSNSNVRLAPGAKIVIPNGPNSLVLTDSELGGCEEMWDAIEVSGGGEFVSSNSLIRDGENGILVSDGGMLNVQNSTFRNNYVSIQTPGDAVSAIDADFTIRDNVFEADVLLPPFAGQPAWAGIRVFDLQNSLILKNNTYRDMTFGIIGNNSTVLINYDRFENLSEAGIDVSSTGTNLLMQLGNGPASAPTFDNCHIGIRADNMIVLSSLNLMENVKTGYSLRNGIFKNVSLNSNTIRAERTGIAFNQWWPLSFVDVRYNTLQMDGNQEEGTAIVAELLFGTNSKDCRFRDNTISLADARFGIRLNNSSNMGLRQNDLTLENQMPYDGILLEGSGLNRLYCNLVTGTDITNFQAGYTLSQANQNFLNCNTADDTRSGILVLGESNPTTLEGNSFHTHFNALQVGFPQVVGGVTGVQEHHGNMWQETYTGGAVGAAHYGTSFQVNESQLRVDQSDGSNLISNEYTESGASLFDQQPGNTYLCNTAQNGCPVEPEGFVDEISTTDREVANGGIDPGVFTAAQEWTAKRQLYRRLLHSPGLIDPGSSIETFFNAESSTTAGAFEELGRDMEALFEIGAVTKALMLVDDSTLQVRVEELLTVVEQLDTASAPGSKANLEAQKLAIQQDIATLTSAQSAREDSLKTARFTSATGLLADNAAISTAAVYETNQASYNQVFLEMLVNDQVELSANQLTILRGIANQCPFEGGEAVHQARALLGDGAAYDDITLCQSGGSALQKPRQEEGIAFTVWPNPSNGLLNIELENKAVEDGEIILANALGRRFHRQTFSVGDKSILMFFENVPSGTYYLTVKDALHSSSQVITILK